MNQRWKLHLLCVASMSLPVAAQAEDTIATDRPDVVESSEVVGKGRFQIETSYAAEREAKHSPKTRVHSTPTLLRIGVSDTVELRMETDGLMRVNTWDNGQRSSVRGSSDIAFGLKWHVRTPADGESGPSTAWLIHFDAPTGTHEFRGQGVRPSARFVSEWDFGKWSLGVMPGIYSDRDEQNKRYVGGIFAVVAGTSLADRLRGFVEFSGEQLAAKKSGGSVIALDAGLAYLITDKVQVDVAVAKGLSSAAPKQKWTTGLSMLF
jgi:hypothetical protein